VARQIVVSGGAGFWCGDDGLALDRFVLSLTGEQRPRVCYLATAAGDSGEFIGGFYDNLGPLAQVTHLPLFLPPFRDPAETLLAQDLIYVGGGSTSNMLAVWRLHGIDQLLEQALDAGTILYGSSAGGICWYEGGITDSLSFDGSLRPLTDGLGFVRGSHSPHFDNGQRRAAYEAMVRTGDLPAGVGVDEFAAVHYVDGELHEVVSSQALATAHIVRQHEYSTSAEPLTARLLG
jgi:peptidase E